MHLFCKAFPRSHMKRVFPSFKFLQYFIHTSLPAFSSTHLSVNTPHVYTFLLYLGKTLVNVIPFWFMLVFLQRWIRTNSHSASVAFHSNPWLGGHGQLKEMYPIRCCSSQPEILRPKTLPRVKLCDLIYFTTGCSQTLPSSQPWC